MARVCQRRLKPLLMLRLGLGGRKSFSTTQAVKGKGFVTKTEILLASKHQNSGAKAQSTPAQGVKQSWSCNMSRDVKGLPMDRIISWVGLALKTFLSGPECFVCISLPLILTRLLCYISSVHCWCMNSWKRPHSQSLNYPRHLTALLSFNLNFQTANFCLALWLSQKQILCGFIAKK